MRLIKEVMEEAIKLSITQCRKILEEGGRSYSDEQVGIIRDILYNLGELDYLIFKEMQICQKKDENQSITDHAA